MSAKALPICKLVNLLINLISVNFLTKYQVLTGKLNYALFLALFIALPLPRVFLQPIAVAWVIAWVLECRFVVE